MASDRRRRRRRNNKNNNSQQDEQQVFAWRASSGPVLPFRRSASGVDERPAARVGRRERRRLREARARLEAGSLAAAAGRELGGSEKCCRGRRTMGRAAPRLAQLLMQSAALPRRAEQSRARSARLGSSRSCTCARARGARPAQAELARSLATALRAHGKRWKAGNVT